MNLHNLTPAKGSVRTAKRLARGSGSGYGNTAGRGHKGDGSRSGYKNKKGFEGGQMPIQRRVPKKGFKNINRVEYAPINLSTLQYLAENKGITEFLVSDYAKLGLCAKTDKVKLLGRGEISKSVKVQIHASSAAAKEAIEKVGGTVNIV